MQKPQSTQDVEALWRKAEAHGLSRRRFLGLLSSGGTAAVLGVCAGIPVAAAENTGSRAGGMMTNPASGRLHVQPDTEPFFIPHGTNSEMRWGLQARGDCFVMDTGQFFIRNHGATPIIDHTQWRLRIEGSAVKKPLALSYDDLTALPSSTLTRFIECAGNARSFYAKFLDKPGQGTQWLLGGYGVASWTGVPLAEILDRAGVTGSAVSIMASGLDTSGFKKATPIDKAMAEDTLVVYGMNGAPLPYDHGFPARLLVPGWLGSFNVKWLGSLEVADEPLWSKWNTSSYVLIGPDYEDPGGPPEGELIYWQTMKSAVALPWPAVLKPGQQRVRGYAWSPHARIAKVEISLDGGNGYQPAELIEPNIAAAGARWAFTLDAQPGLKSITPRATDEKGNRQWPISEQVWNKKGYIWGAVVPHPVDVAP
ncbi:MAG: sulfite oxidase [Nitrococcus sp.]|nr:sulfite oxidase [Nitrococcus sp.]